MKMLRMNFSLSNQRSHIVLYIHCNGYYLHYRHNLLACQLQNTPGTTPHGFLITARAFTNTMLSPFTGPIFEILAAPEQIRFVAHAGILEKSEKLKAVTCGNWKDSSECKIVLGDWDSKTVGRLLEWLYSGDYESPSPSNARQSEAESLEIRVSETTVSSKQGADSPSITLKKIESAKASNRPLTSLQNIYFDEASQSLASSYAEAHEPWARRFAQDPSTLSFEATLLAHAKL